MPTKNKTIQANTNKQNKEIQLKIAIKRQLKN